MQIKTTIAVRLKKELWGKLAGQEVLHAERIISQ